MLLSNKYRFLLVGLVIVIILGISSYWFYISHNKKELVINKEDTLKVEKIVAKEKPIKKYYVDIKGAIANPGVYSVEFDARVIDIINMAGGLSKNADTSYINLGKKVFDEMVIIIFNKNEVLNYKNKYKELVNLSSSLKTNIKNDSLITTNIIADSAVELGTPTNNSKNEDPINALVSINQGSLTQLQTLSGIGATKAQDIISYREANGRFKNLEDLKNVKGIGEATFAKIKNYITL